MILTVLAVVPITTMYKIIHEIIAIVSFVPVAYINLLLTYCFYCLSVFSFSPLKYTWNLHKSSL